MDHSELRELLRQHITDSFRHREMSNWIQEKDSIRSAWEIALYLADPDTCPLPTVLRKRDWLACFLDPKDSSTHAIRITSCTRQEALERTPQGEGFVALLPASILDDEPEPTTISFY